MSDERTWPVELPLEVIRRIALGGDDMPPVVRLACSKALAAHRRTVNAARAAVGAPEFVEHAARRGVPSNVPGFGDWSRVRQLDDDNQHQQEQKGSP